MKLIVTDMDGTLLNSRREISAENVTALLAAEAKGMEIAIATGRTYGNALALCRSAGLRPHIISNHGAFVYTKEGKKILSIGMARNHIQEALTWLVDNDFFYNVCTDTHSLIPAGSERMLLNDYKTAKTVIPGVTERSVQKLVHYLSRTAEDRALVDGMADILNKDLTYGSIVAITFSQDKLKTGRDYFARYQELSMTVAGNAVFEMTHTSVSKGNALEHLTKYLAISMAQVMAIGDNYNDISMLERVGLSIAMENAEEAVKKVCQYVSLSNDLHGVAHCINQYIK